MESYIVRIYRRGKNLSRTLFGVVEQVGASEKKPFTNLDELWYILNSTKEGPAKSRKQERV